MDNNLPDMRTVIETLALERHPIAGWHSLHYSDGTGAERANLSSSYILLAGDEPMPMRKLDGVEVWHFHMGAPAELIFASGTHRPERFVLGPDILADQLPQIAVPAFSSRSCRSLGLWTLMGCTMSPGYSSRSSRSAGTGI